MKTLILLILTSSILSAQKVDLKLPEIKSETILLSGAAAGFGVMLLNKPKTSKQALLKRVEILAIVITTGIVLFENDRIQVNSSGVNFKLKYKRFKCLKR